MKNITKYTLWALLNIVVITSCEKKSDPVTPILTINSVQVFLPDTPAGASEIVSFHTNLDWSAELQGARANEYFELSASHGGSGDGYITVRTRAVNATYDDQVATLRISVDGKSESVALVQRRKGSIVMDNKEVSVPQAGGDFAVQLKTNLDYTVEISPATPWVFQKTTKAITEHTLEFTAEPNTTHSDRKAEIIICDRVTKMSDTIRVEQFQVNGIILSERNVSVGEGVATVEVKLSSNVDYDVVMPTADWVSRVVTTKALVDTPYSFAVAENTTFEKRMAQVIFKHRTTALADTLTITQMQKGAVVFDRRDFNVDVNGATIVVGYEATVALEARVNRAWIKAAGTKALERRTVEFAIDENTDNQNRSGWIVFENTAVGVRDTVYIFQRGVEQAARADSMALLDLFRATGRAWTNNLNWGSQLPMSQWYGVKINRFTRRVTEIAMRNNNMQGELPASFTNLTALETVDFTGNGIRGELPVAISDLSSLEGVYLANNAITGNIPYGVAGMAKLRALELKNNKMEGEIPAEIFAHKFWLTWKPTVNIAPGNNFTNINNYADFDRELSTNVLMHKTAKLLNVRVSPDVFAAWNAGTAQFEPLTKEIYGVMKDNFDMVFFVMANPEGTTFRANENAYYELVKNTVKGIGLEQTDRSANFGSGGKLQYVMMLDAVDAVGKSTVLHRMLHRWGNYVLPARGLDATGVEVDMQPHWGVSDAEGMLGGFSAALLTSNVGGSAEKYSARFSMGVDGFGQTENNAPTLSPIELHLLGMEDKSQVSPVTLYTGLSWESAQSFATGTFVASGSKRYSVADVVKANGERLPGYSVSQKEFKVMIVVVSSGAVSNEEASLVIADLDMFVGRRGGRPTPTFAAATLNMGSLVADDMTEDVK